jgi:hypothetical protein
MFSEFLKNNLISVKGAKVVLVVVGHIAKKFMVFWVYLIVLAMKVTSKKASNNWIF